MAWKLKGDKSGSIFLGGGRVDILERYAEKCNTKLQKFKDKQLKVFIHSYYSMNNILGLVLYEVSWTFLRKDLEK